MSDGATYRAVPLFSEGQLKKPCKDKRVSFDDASLAEKLEVALSVSLHEQVGQAGIRDRGSHSRLNSICTRGRSSANICLSGIKSYIGLHTNSKPEVRFARLSLTTFLHSQNFDWFSMLCLAFCVQLETTSDNF